MKEKIYRDILAVDCRCSELLEFSCNLSNEELDRDNSVEKYYSLETILLAIKRYKDKEITRKYLAHWANAYNWIISASDLDETGYTWIEKHIMYKIFYALDGLSFINTCWCKRKNIYAEKKYFKTLDKIFKNIKDWKFMYRYKGKTYCREDEILVFGYNEKARKYWKFRTDVNLKKDTIDMDTITEKGYIKTLEKDLKSKGYTKI